MGERVFVTGATGFVGEHLVRSLIERGDTVTALARPTSDTPALERMGAAVVRGDVADYEAVRRAAAGARVVFSCATPTDRGGRSPEEHRRVDVIGVENVLRAAVEARARHVVHCSTTQVHGRLRQVPIDEDAPKRPYTPYTRAKLDGERAIERHLAQGLVPVTVARLGSVYGPGSMRWVGLCREILAQRLVLVGSCSQPYSMSYVDDVVEGLLLCARVSTAERFLFIGGECNTTLRDFLEAVAAALGVPFAPRELPAAPFRLASRLGTALLRPLGVRAQAFHTIDFFTQPRAYRTDRARAQLGFQARTPLREGVERMVAWYRDAGLLEKA
jgi:dihydroflavonol-4-reductase